MIDYKLEAAKTALQFIKAEQIIGLGAGSTVAHLIDLIRKDEQLAASLTFVSSSFKTNTYLLQHKLNVQSPAQISKIDIYFDGCDQFDNELNALKSGGGIHTAEKILASMASEFILMGDEGKQADKLDVTYPLVIEIIPMALQAVLSCFALSFPDADVKLRMSNQKDGALISEHGNYLADIHFTRLKELQSLNTQIKMIPGIVEHSLFYKMATKAIVSGKEGTKIITI